MYLDIDKLQLSALGSLNEDKIMEKPEVLKLLKETKVIVTDMLPVIGMPFEAFLAYAQLSQKGKQKVVDKAIKKLDPEYCGACECSPCDCGYGSY